MRGLYEQTRRLGDQLHMTGDLDYKRPLHPVQKPTATEKACGNISANQYPDYVHFIIEGIVTRHGSFFSRIHLRASRQSHDCRLFAAVFSLAIIKPIKASRRLGRFFRLQ